MTLDGEAARAVRLAQEFRHLNPIGEFGQVILAPPGPLATHTARLILDAGAGAPLVIEPLEIDLLKTQGDRVCYTNRRQQSPPLRFRYDGTLATRPEGGTVITSGAFHYGPGSWNVEDRRTVARLVTTLRRPCTLRLLDRSTRETLLEMLLPATAPPAGLDALLALLDALVLLQDRTGVPIEIPDDMSTADLDVLKALGAIVVTGRLIGTWDEEELPYELRDIDAARIALAPLLAGETMALGLEGQGQECFGERTIPLGPTRIHLYSVRLVDPESVIAQLNAGSPNITLRLVPGDDRTIERRYLDWGPRNGPPPSLGPVETPEGDEEEGGNHGQ